MPVIYLAQVSVGIAIFLVVGYSYLKGLPVYETFVDGVREGLHLMVHLAPYIITIYAAVGLFQETGAMEFFSRLISRPLLWAGLPPDLIPLVVVKPFSGPATLAVASRLMSSAGADSLLGRTASVLYASSDTAVYILTIYLGAIGLKHNRRVLWLGLLVNLVACWVGVYTSRTFFG